MRDYRKLKVWRRAHLLALRVYAASHDFPHEERFGLTAQIRRSVTSIASNIAEGSGRPSRRDQRRFVGIASGSCNETEYQLELARDLGYLPEEEWKDLSAEVAEVGSMLSGLDRALRSP